MSIDNASVQPARRFPVQKILLFMVIVLVIVGFYIFDGAQYLSVAQFRQWVQEQPVLATIGYFVLYVLICSLPVAAILTLIGGAVFGFWWGLLLVSFASTLGATLAFVMSRWLLRDWVQQRFGQYLQIVNNGVKKEGAFYLFSMRLIPAFPFFAINLMFGLTPMRPWTFYWVSQIGMLAGTAVYVNVGAQLANIDEISVTGILTPQLIAAFVLLGLFPLVVKKLIMPLLQKRITAKTVETKTENQAG